MNDCLIIEESEKSTRIDKILIARYPQFSRTYFQYLLQEGAVRINDTPCKKRTMPTPGSRVDIAFLPLPDINAYPQDIPIDIVYEDDALAIINKPPHMTVHPAPGNSNGTLVNALLHHFKELMDFDDKVRPGIVHRLDKETSGLMVVAKTPEVQRALSQQFAERSVHKTYLAITYRTPPEGRYEAAIGRSHTDRKKMCVRPDGKPATSLISHKASYGELALVGIDLLTGRTHQIRVHLASLGAPILGDATYGFDGINTRYATNRVLLHSQSLAFIHPQSQKKMAFTTKPPPDFDTYFPRLP